MLGLQITRHAIMAHAGRVPLVRALAIATTTHFSRQHYRAVNDKAREVEGLENAGTMNKSADGPVQRSIDKLEPIKDTLDAAEKTVMPYGEEFWREVPIWKDVSTESFMSYRWSASRALTTSVYRMQTC